LLGIILSVCHSYSAKTGTIRIKKDDISEKTRRKIIPAHLFQ